MNMTNDGENGREVLVLLGGAGDLALRMLLPSLYFLEVDRLLPHDLRIIGVARGEGDGESYKTLVREQLGKRATVEEAAWNRLAARLDYLSVDMTKDEGAAMLAERVGEHGSLVVYFALSPSLYGPVCNALQSAGLTGPKSRLVLEKPIGRDLESSRKTNAAVGAVVGEEQIFRIDHYLGKETVENLTALRFANVLFEPLWDRNTIDHVQITWKENIGVGDRGGYYDNYGIIRDVMQNHLLQIMALAAMEPPSRPDAASIRGKTVELLRDVPPLRLEDLVLGQYTSAVTAAGRQRAYLEESNMPAGSRTSTYAAAVLRVNNWRWDGVPFFMRAGKALETKLCEVRLCFKQTPANIFSRYDNSRLPDELVIRIQPDEAIYFKIINKVPGLHVSLGQSMLDMQYSAVFGQEIPDAYECLLMDVLEGDKTMFVSTPELGALWDVFTPVLHDIDARQIRPDPYPFLSRGPSAADALIERYGRKWAN